jgi:hypothetical protein
MRTKAARFRFSVNLNEDTDNDIIEFLDGQNKQFVVKKAIRLLMSLVNEEEGGYNENRF